jgi:hypothetical protein
VPALKEPATRTRPGGSGLRLFDAGEGRTLDDLLQELWADANHGSVTCPVCEDAMRWRPGGAALECGGCRSVLDMTP